MFGVEPSPVNIFSPISILLAIHKAPDVTTSGRMYEKVKSLSLRETEVVRCYLDGLSVSQITVKFKRSCKTISGQKQSVLKNLGLRSNSERFTYSHDLIPGA